MCRYATKTFKSHFACFHCRKTFKRPNIIDLAEQHGDGPFLKKLYSLTPKMAKKLEEDCGVRLSDLREKYIKMISLCPQCGCQMADLGLDFKAPKITDKTAWKAIALTHKIGHQWYTCGCNGPGFVPKNQREYLASLQEKLIEYKCYLGKLSGRELNELEKIDFNIFNDRVKSISLFIKTGEMELN